MILKGSAKMYYEINVALKGRHFFATAERSITCEDDLKTVYKALAERFKEEDGFKLSVTKWSKTGQSVDMIVL
jgi:hypothetical protein